MIIDRAVVFHHRVGNDLQVAVHRVQGIARLPVKDGLRGIATFSGYVPLMYSLQRFAVDVGHFGEAAMTLGEQKCPHSGARRREN